MHLRDECKTTFMTETCCYCYKVMPFGLKNAGTTYQRLMDKVLAPMLGRNVQTYVDDMVVTSQEKGRHTTDLEELFTTIAKYRLKMNPEKCVFEVEASNFLGFLLLERGIEANPDKCATRYPSLEKAALAVVFSARRLRHYFQSFTVVVIMDLPIQKVLQKPDVAGRMVRWAVELSEFDILYEPRGSIKGQVYADFLAELSPGSTQQKEEVGS